MNIYGKRLVRLPVPKLIVFYNGIEEKEDDLLKLSDAFEDNEESAKADIEKKAVKKAVKKREWLC